jgi:membrane-associated phospholipid phosphatase
MDRLIQIDQSMTLWINQHHSVPLDVVVMPVAWLGEMGIGWIILMLIMMIYGRRRERLLTLIFLAGLLITEFLIFPLFRDAWPRTRPYMYLAGVRPMGVRWEKFSFPSAHMHPTMMATILFGAAYRRSLWPLIIFTLITGYSRPYAGMHHVLDVVVGAGIGAVVGVAQVVIARRLGLLSRRGPGGPEAPPAQRAPGGSDGPTPEGHKS